MDDVDIPSHNTHLEMLDCLIATVVRKKKLSNVTVRDLNKVSTKQHMATFTHGPVYGKDFTKVQVERWFITMCLPRSKGDGMECALAGQSHVTKSISRHILGN
jgi:hypothetical protein